MFSRNSGRARGGENVYVLDPCCGTGAYLSKVLRCVAAQSRRGVWEPSPAHGSSRRRPSACSGFEILPAPFVVAHLQVGLTLLDLGAPLADDGAERPGVFLTNALTDGSEERRSPCPSPNWRKNATGRSR